MVAYHSVLVFNVLGVSGFGDESMPPTADPARLEQPLIDLIETYNNVTARNVLESYHDAQQALDMALNLFSGGYLPLEQRVHAENALLGDLPQAAAARAAAGRRARGTAEPRRDARRTPISATSRCSSRCPTAGRSSSCSRSCRFTG